VTQAVPLLLKFPMEHFSVDYDREADVLYISFRRPQKATDTRVTAEGLLLRYHDEELVGITILEASSRAEEPPFLAGESRDSAQPRRRPAKKKS
jgi:uncharacterized protein YuzE